MSAEAQIVAALLRLLAHVARGFPWIPFAIISLLLASALFAPLIAPHDPTRIDVLRSRLAPLADAAHPLGTDLLGRDILSRIIYGGRTAVSVIAVALGAGALIGTVLGLVSGYAGGIAEAFIMRIVDAFMGFPTILVAMVMVVILGPTTGNVIAAVAITVWPTFARMVRGETLVLKHADFVTLARIAGVRPSVIVVRHILPNLVSTLAILVSLRIGQVILLEASLSFLGIGLAPGAPAWGIMVSEGRDVIVTVWWLALFPGIAITAVVLSFNLLGDWLRDRLDPRLRQI